MKPIIIKITNHKGEIENGHSCQHHFDGGRFTKQDVKKEVVYYVGVSFIDGETNTILNTEKEFDSYENALKFLKLFVSKKPISEGVIFKKTTREILHYV